jgi:hypothetical protein
MHPYSISGDTALARSIGVERSAPSNMVRNEGRRGSAARITPTWLGPLGRPVGYLLSRGADAIAFTVAYVLLAAALPIMLATAPITRVSSGDIHDD